MVTPNQLGAAKKAALRCAHSAADVCLWGSTQKCFFALGDHLTESVKKSAADVFADCVEAFAESKAAISGKVREALLLTKAGEKVPIEEVAGRSVSLWHDAASQLAAGTVQLLIKAELNIDGMEQVVASMGKQGVGERLRRCILACNGATGEWHRLVERAADYQCGNYEAIFAGIEQEWAAARRMAVVPPDDEPLTDRQREVDKWIRAAGKPVTGKKIVRALDLPSESYLTRHIIPVLKKRKGLKNRAGAGYYYPSGN